MRRSLGLLIVSGLLPIVALGGIFGTLTLRAQRDAVEEHGRTYARFAAALVETKLSDSTSAMRAMADSPAFADPTPDGAQVRLLATGLLARQRAWRAISVADADGRRLLGYPAAGAGGAERDPASLRKVMETGQPAIGRVLADPGGQAAFAIRAPVVRDGHVRFVVSALVPAESLGQLLQFEALPPGWRAVMIDGAGSVVASTSADSNIAGPANAVALDARRAGRTAPYRFRRRDGMVSVGLFTRVRNTGWTVHVSAPDAYYSGPTRHAVILLVVAVLLCLLLFFLLARLLLAEMRASRQREAAALQRQRMEALGQLTGGVAHDFNNLLTPIIGGHDLLRRRLADDELGLRYLDLAATAAERAKQLVARLLSFSRRQTLAPADTDVAALIAGLLEIVRRSLPPAVEVTLDLPAGLPTAHADPGQLELAILNLAINARDAMPDGGRIGIAARVPGPGEADLAPGRYLAVSVSDTGTGMDEATLRQAVDPFFTTKSAEQGTGLGLSMVHGFAAQSGGVLRLESSPGVGTVATIILPQGGAAAAEEAEPGAAPAFTGGGRRILLVDDDPAARASTRALLEAFAHDVAEADGVDAALRWLRGGWTVDAIVTDYLMPGRSGAELIAAVRAGPRPPAMLLITGYMGEAGDVPADVPKLTKPFDADELDRALARALGATPAARGVADDVAAA